MFTFHWWQQLCLLIQPRDIKTQRRHSWVDTTSPLFFPAKFTYLECFPKGQTTNGLHSAPMHASVQIWIGKVCYQYSNVATISSTFSRNEIKVKGFSLLTHISTSKQLKHHKHTTARTDSLWLVLTNWCQRKSYHNEEMGGVNIHEISHHSHLHRGTSPWKRKFVSSCRHFSSLVN